MTDTIQNLKEQYGANSPAVAEQLNLIGAELYSRGDIRTSLKFHQEALTILEWNKCNALLYDFVKKSKEYTVDMARTLCKIGNLMRETNNFVGAAEVYKECLDMFLEGLVEGGGGLKRKLLECEYKRDSERYQAVLAQVDRKAIGRILCLNPDFRSAVREISQLFLEMQCVKFVGQNAASSRWRRRMVQHKAMEDNLKHAVESLSMASPTPQPSSNEKKGLHRRQLSRSMSCISNESGETWEKTFWEKEMGRFSRPRPLSRRSITSDEEDNRYKVLSSMIVPAEESLSVALKRFPLPASVVGDNKCLRQSSSLSSFHQAEAGYTERDSEERTNPPPPHLTTSPRSVAQPIYQEDNIFKNNRF